MIDPLRIVCKGFVLMLKLGWIMNKIPMFFLTFSKNAGLSDDNAKELWERSNANTLERFFSWLIRSNSLEDKQIEELERIFKEVSKSMNKGDFMDMIFSVLTKKQKKASIKVYAEVYLDELESLFNKVESRMKPEQKQVINAYLESI